MTASYVLSAPAHRRDRLRRRVSILLATSLLGCSQALAASDSPAGAVLYRLDGTADVEAKPEYKENPELRGYPILDLRSVARSKFTTKLWRLLTEAKSRPRSPSASFYPRDAVSMFGSAGKVEALLCFECKDAAITGVDHVVSLTPEEVAWLLEGFNEVFAKEGSE